jgi:Phage capsid protein
MSFNVTPAMQSLYNNNVELALQQQDSMLEGAVDSQDDISADMVKVKDIVGNTLPQEANERHGDTKYSNPTYDGVWLAKPNELYYADLIDNADQLGTSISLEGTSTQTGAGTVQRAKDQRILEGFYGPIQSGKTGTITTPFPSTQTVQVNVGSTVPDVMNVAKLRAANKMLLQNYVDVSQPKYMVLTADDNDALLTEVPATNADFKAAYGGVVSDGMLQGLLGWNFIHMELDNPLLGTVPALATDASGYRKTPFWAKRGVRANFWQRLRTSLDKMPGKVLSVQVFAGTTVAATRTQPGYSGIILNKKG